jgi:hypothetical protein
MPSPSENPWPAVSFAGDLGYWYDRAPNGVEPKNTHLRNQAEYADEKHHEKPQRARGDHRGYFECDHAA